MSDKYLSSDPVTKEPVQVVQQSSLTYVWRHYDTDYYGYWTWTEQEIRGRNEWAYVYWREQASTRERSKKRKRDEAQAIQEANKKRASEELAKKRYFMQPHDAAYDIYNRSNNIYQSIGSIRITTSTSALQNLILNLIKLRKNDHAYGRQRW